MHSPCACSADECEGAAAAGAAAHEILLSESVAGGAIEQAADSILSQGSKQRQTS
jgi:hypothetical protein